MHARHVRLHAVEPLESSALTTAVETLESRGIDVDDGVDDRIESLDRGESLVVGTSEALGRVSLRRPDATERWLLVTVERGYGVLALLRVAHLVAALGRVLPVDVATVHPGEGRHVDGDDVSADPDLRDVAAVTYFGTAAVETVGRDRLLSAPALANRAYDDGSVLLVAGTRDGSSSVETVAEYLETPATVTDDRTPVGLPASPPPDTDPDDPVALLDYLGTWNRGDARDRLERLRFERAGSSDEGADSGDSYARQVDRLAALAADPRSSVRREVAWALGTIGRDHVPGRAVDALADLLADADADVREEAMDALEPICDVQDGPDALPEGTVETVREAAFDDPEPSVREAAVAGLCALSPEFVDRAKLVELLRELYDTASASNVQAAAISNLVIFGRRRQDVRRAFDAMAPDRPREVRRRAATALRTNSMFFGSEPEWLDAISAHGEEIRVALNADDANVQQAAVEVLGLLDDEDVLDLLANALDHDDPNVRAAAATAVETYGDPAGVDRLLGLLDDPEEFPRREAVAAIRTLADGVDDPDRFQAAVDPLVALLDDESEDVRRNSTEALGAIGHPDAVDPLVAAFEAGQYRTQCARALGRIGGDGTRYLRERVPAADVLTATIAGLGEADDDEVPDLLLELLRADVAGALVEALGRQEATGATGELVEQLRAGNREAVEALGDLGESAVRPLLDALDDEEDAVRRRAAEALGLTGSSRALEPLFEAIESDDRHRRLGAVRGLWKIDDDQVPDVLDLVAEIDPDEEIRKAAEDSCLRYSMSHS